MAVDSFKIDAKCPLCVKLAHIAEMGCDIGIERQWSTALGGAVMQTTYCDRSVEVSLLDGRTGRGPVEG